MIAVMIHRVTAHQQILNPGGSGKPKNPRNSGVGRISVFERDRQTAFKPR
jgi:hypothetical protein